MANQDLSNAIELLKNLLGDGAGGKVDEIVETLGLGGAANMNKAPQEQPDPAPVEAAPTLPAEPAVPAPSGQNAKPPMDLSGVLGGMGSLGSLKNNPHMNLLLALKPYMNPVRASKIDSAIKIVQLAQISKGLGLFHK